MVPKSVIARYFAKPRRDYRVYKRLTTPQIREHYDLLAGKPPIWKRLHRDQRICFLLGAKTGRFAFFNDCGTGKTILSIALIRYFKAIEKVRHVLVLVPNKINKSEWAREIDKHSPSTDYCVLRGSSVNKWQQLRATEALIIVETYGGLLRMVCDLKRVYNKRKNVFEDRLKPNPRKLRELLGKIDGLVLDESTTAKTWGKLPFRICRQISKHSAITFALTGTPFGRDPTDLWAQMFLVDHGETLGQTLGLFRAAFFTEKLMPWGGIEYTFQKKHQHLLNRLLANRSIRYEADEADLPQLVPIIKEVSLPSDARVYIAQAKASMMKFFKERSRGNYREMKNAFLRMRQISSGFLGYYDDDDGSKAEYEFDAKPKLELLLSLLESIRPDRKAIVFHEYNFSGAMIARELDRLKLGYLRIWGRMKGKADDVLQGFDHDPDKRILLLSNSCSFGLNLQTARYGIFYESPVSPLMRKQARSRFERQHSTHEKVFQYDLITRGTYDARILAFLAEGRDLFEAIVDGKAPIL